jgi:outer membrane lipoprotein-sorting protein
VLHRSLEPADTVCYRDEPSSVFNQQKELIMTSRRLLKTLAAAVAVMLGTLAAGTATGGEAKSAREIWEFVAEKAQTHKTMSADMKQSMSMMGTDMVMTSKVQHKKPNQVRIEMAIPIMGKESKMLLVTGADGIMWQEMSMAGQRQVMKIDTTQAKGGDGQKLDLNGKIDPSEQWKETANVMDFTVLPEEEIDGQPVYVLDGVWNAEADKAPQFKAMKGMIAKSRIFIGSRDGYVRKMLMYGQDGKTVVMSTEFTNIKFDVEIADDTFVYKPEEGAKVVDMTGMMATGGAVVPQPAAPDQEK